MIPPKTPTVIVTVEYGPDDTRKSVTFAWQEDADRMRAGWRSTNSNHVTHVMPTNTIGEYSVYLIDPDKIEYNAGITGSVSGQRHKDAWLCAASWALGGKNAHMTLVSIELSS